MPWTDTIDPLDDTFHRRNADPYWNESTFTSFSIPEHHLMGLVYYYFRPNMNLAVAGTMIWDPSGEDIYNCRHYAWDQIQAIPEGADMNEFAMPNGLRVSTRELQRSYAFTYEGLDCNFELEFTAAREPYYMRMKDDLNDAAKDWAGRGIPDDVTIGHYEQCGWVRGTLTLGDTALDVDCTSLRDHTWGPRPMFTNRPRIRGGYPFAMASEDSSFQAYAPSPHTSDDDPFFDTVEPVVSGWYVKDGVLGELTSGTRMVVERGEDLRPLREVIEAKDHLGRTLYAEGTMQTWLKLTGWTDWLFWWGLATWEYDGQVVDGEHTDYCTFRHYRRALETSAERGAVGA